MSDTLESAAITFGRLTHLLLGNFKAFGRRQRIPIRPITLVYGRNNSGKSSIIQALLYAEHARRTGDLMPDVVLKEGQPVLEGGVERLVHGRTRKNTMEFGWEWANQRSVVGLTSGKISQKIHMDHSIGGEVEMESVLNGQVFLNLPDITEAWVMAEPNAEHPAFQMALTTIQLWLAKEFRLRIACDLGSEDLLAALEEAALALEKGAYATLIHKEFCQQSHGLRLAKMGLPPSFRYLPRFQEYFEDGIRPRRGFSMVRAALGVEWLDGCYREFADAPDQLGEGLCNDVASHVRKLVEERGAYSLYRWFADVWEHFDAPLDSLLGTSRYLPAVRKLHERITFDAPRSEDTTYRGPTRHEWIIQTQAIGKVNTWLKAHRHLTGDLEIRYDELTVARKGSQKQQPEGRFDALLSLYDRQRKLPLRVSEVGFGISQFLPVLLACFSSQPSRENSPAGALLIEEPEAHVHPALQAEIGDLFVDAVTRRKQPLAHVICETHSEHVLLRIMRRVREGKLLPDQVAVLYVEDLGTESMVREMPLNENGELIRDWPGGFFEEGLREVLY